MAIFSCVCTCPCIPITTIFSCPFQDSKMSPFCTPLAQVLQENQLFRWLFWMEQKNFFPKFENAFHSQIVCFSFLFLAGKKIFGSLKCFLLCNLSYSKCVHNCNLSLLQEAADAKKDVNTDQIIGLIC